MTATHHQQQHMHGIALIEALVATLILSLCLLGLSALHLRTLAQSQQSTHRLQAIRLIEDFSERLHALPNPTTVATHLHTQGWQTGAPQAPSSACYSSSCNASTLATVLRQQWLRQVFATLSQAQANVFATTSSQQLGVALAWPNHDAARGDAMGLLSHPLATGNASVDCPANHSCHFQLLHLSAL